MGVNKKTQENAYDYGVAVMKYVTAGVKKLVQLSL